MIHETSKTADKPLKIFIAQNIIWVVLAGLVILGGFARDWLSERWQYSEFTLRQLSNDASKDIIIIDYLYKILESTHADRVRVFRVHNGGAFAGPLPFKKVSCTHEATRAGISRANASQQNVPLSAIPELVKYIVNNPHAFIVRVDELPVCPWRAILEVQGIKLLAICRIMQGEEVWGVVSVSYNTVPTAQPDLNTLDMFTNLIQLETIKARR